MPDVLGGTPDKHGHDRTCFAPLRRRIVREANGLAVGHACVPRAPGASFAPFELVVRGRLAAAAGAAAAPARDGASRAAAVAMCANVGVMKWTSRSKLFVLAVCSETSKSAPL